MSTELEQLRTRIIELEAQVIELRSQLSGAKSYNFGWRNPHLDDRYQHESLIDRRGLLSPDATVGDLLDHIESEPICQRYKS